MHSPKQSSNRTKTRALVTGSASPTDAIQQSRQRHGSSKSPPNVIASSEVARHRMSRVRQRDTAPELAVRSELHRRGIRFRLHRPLIPGMKRTVDIVLPSSKIAVFIDGCYWHSCPLHGSLPKANRA